MIEVKGLVKRYGNFTVLKGIDFTVEKGSVFGFLGQNGAGKSTTMNIMTGLIDFQGGQVVMDGLNLQTHKNLLRQRIGYLPENPVFYGYMNAYEYLRFIADVSQYPAHQVTKRVDELLELVQLKQAAKRRVGGYSRGMKQRLGLAIALFNEPDYLFLDEPTSALDPEGRMEMLTLMEAFKESATTVFLSTHILADVERVCDRVSILHQGEIKLTEKMADLQQRYLQPIFDLEVDGNPTALLRQAEPLPWVEKVAVEGNKAAVHVNDIGIGQRELPKVIADSGLPLRSYQIRQTTLEDIFLRMVKQDGNL